MRRERREEREREERERGECPAGGSRGQKWERSASAEDPRLEAQNLPHPTKLQPHISQPPHPAATPPSFLPSFRLLPSPSSHLSLSLYAPKKPRQARKEEAEKSPFPVWAVAVRRGPRTRIMSAAAGDAGNKEKGGGGACELCGAAARVYCGADEATLCWGCDAQVHGANFLVARHARALLCRGCARPTPWRAAGPRLGPTASLCDRCVRRGLGAVGGDDEEMGGGRGGQGEEEDEEGGDGDDDDEVVVEDDEEDEEEEEEGEGENQVVPWTEEAEATPPPVASSTSSSSREAPANGADAKVPPLSSPPPPLSLRLLLDLVAPTPFLPCDFYSRSDRVPF